MILYDFSTISRAKYELPEQMPDSGLFIICSAGEIGAIGARLGWDKGAVFQGANLAEKIRYACYDGYDFISLIYLELQSEFLVQHEINLFFSRRYLVLVLPEHAGSSLEALEAVLCRNAENCVDRLEGLSHMYYSVFSALASDFSSMLEELEDEMEALSEAVAKDSVQDQIVKIEKLRTEAYTAKKLLRSLSYIGTEILADENGLLDKRKLHHFRSIDIRLKKLHDFAEILYTQVGEIFRTYNNNMSSKMNQAMNRLSVITLLFLPLTVITGIYGMNFSNMPELAWTFGYPLVLSLMAAISLVVLFILRKYKWL